MLHGNRLHDINCNVSKSRVDGAPKGNISSSTDSVTIGCSFSVLLISTGLWVLKMLQQQLDPKTYTE